MTDTQLVEAVLKACGWTYEPSGIDSFGVCFNAFWYRKHETITESKVPPILTSLDACHELFEKDAPDEYWGILWEECGGTRYCAHKATGRQRCEAFLKWKGIEV